MSRFQFAPTQRAEFKIESDFDQYLSTVAVDVVTSPIGGVPDLFVTPDGTTARMGLLYSRSTFDKLCHRLSPGFCSVFYSLAGVDQVYDVRIHDVELAVEMFNKLLKVRGRIVFDEYKRAISTRDNFVVGVQHGFQLNKHPIEYYYRLKNHLPGYVFQRARAEDYRFAVIFGHPDRSWVFRGTTYQIGYLICFTANHATGFSISPCLTKSNGDFALYPLSLHALCYGARKATEKTAKRLLASIPSEEQHALLLEVGQQFLVELHEKGRKISVPLGKESSKNTIQVSLLPVSMWNKQLAKKCARRLLNFIETSAILPADVLKGGYYQLHADDRLSLLLEEAYVHSLPDWLQWSFRGINVIGRACLESASRSVPGFEFTRYSKKGSYSWL